MYPVVKVAPSDADSVEPMGTKTKFWFDHPDYGRCLFKVARPGTGEDWAEKVASEICRELRIPHAEYHLAESEGCPGTVSPSFVPKGSTLIHGNEILGGIPGYPKPEQGQKQFYRVSKHTLAIVLAVMGNPRVQLPIGEAARPGLARAVEGFVGYLMLDALIGNTDRHHENWALVRAPGGPNEGTALHLAPTYDHASSLGRNESDARRRARLDTRDPGFGVPAYAERALSAIYDQETDERPLVTVEAFRRAAQRHPKAAAAWLEALEALELGRCEGILAGVPTERLSNDAREFAAAMLKHNRDRLLGLRGELT